MNTSAQELAKERLACIEAAMKLQEPDRVPCWGIGGDIVASYTGITQYEFAYDEDKCLQAVETFVNAFPFDEMSLAGASGVDGRPIAMSFIDYPEIFTNLVFITGPLHDALGGNKYYRFPGREIGEDSTPQFIGGTFMESDEYDELIKNPVEFIRDTVLPRAIPRLANPRDAMATWVRLGMAIDKGFAFFVRLGNVLAKAGYAPVPMGWACAPLDFIADYLRGFDTVMLDIYRYPDKVKKAVEALAEPVVDFALSSSKHAGAKIVMCPLHLNDYLSPKIYNEFYWPTLKKVLLSVIDEGLKPIVFFEGNHEPHLQTILELPKGWGVAYFEKTDVIKAKEVLKGHTCIMGGMPISLLVSGTPEQIDEHIRNLMGKVKSGGGFILALGVGNVPRETPIENIKALLEAGQKYGKYG
jgi:hypothetical protein